MTASVGSVVESIRFERERVPCDFVPYEGYFDDNPKPFHTRWRYSIYWTNPDGTDSEVYTHKCWHPFCDDSPWVTLMRMSENEPDRYGVVMTAWVTPSHLPPVAVAYLLRQYEPVRAEPVIVARIGIPDQWEDRWGGNNRGELFSRRYYADKGLGVYPAAFAE